MILLTAVLYPQGNPSESRELLHGTITNTTIGEPTNGLDTYSAHILARPKKDIGIEGFEADLRVDGYNRSLGIAPLIGSILYHAVPVPLEFEPHVTLDARLTLKEMDEFDARLRGRS